MTQGDEASMETDCDISSPGIKYWNLPLLFILVIVTISGLCGGCLILKYLLNMMLKTKFNNDDDITETSYWT